ncbi:MAG: mechanosensitive ion channel [Rhizobiales bacterium]|nr:mechanosensitive ion channel [Hyphomicrobiales bacterium]
MRILVLLSLLFLLPAATPAVAQQTTKPAASTATAPAGADVETLIRILEDDKARGRLINNLRAAAAEKPADKPSFLAVSDDPIAHQIAQYTRNAAESVAGMFGTLAGFVRQIADILSGAATVDIWALWNVMRNVTLVIAATFATYLALRLAFRQLQHTLAGAATRGFIRRVGVVGLSAAVDAATVLAAWGIGYVFALNIDQPGQTGINRALFLNAFLIVELIKVAARTLLAPRWSALRISGIDDTTAAYWYFWLSRLVSVIGYTFLFVAPIFAANVSRDAANVISVIVMFAALVMASAIVLQNRDAVRAHLTRRALVGRTDTLSRSLAAIAGIWHIIAIAYLTLVFVLWIVDHEAALPFVLAATIQSLIAITLGLLLIAFITRLASGGMQLPADVRERLPLLERRLNAFVPNVLRVVRAVVGVGVVLVITQVWQVVDFVGWLSTEIGQQFVTSLVSTFLILLVGGLIYLAVQSWVEYRQNPHFGTVPTPRQRTLLSLFRNAFTIVLAVMVVMLALSELGVNIGPLLAGAGVVGLAVGFGAQKLVQDVINGAFIQFENAMNEGDVVTAGGVTGVVERLTIRSVSLRTLDGAYQLIPFSSVDSVSNFMKHFGYHVAAIGVAYRENIPAVKQAMQDAFDRLRQTEFGQHIVGDLEMHGVTEFGASAVMVRARIMTMPGEQWAAGRAYNELIKEVFDERGIEIPFPHMTLYMGEDKQGKSPPLRIEPLNVGQPRSNAAKRKRRDTAAAEPGVRAPRRRKTKVKQDAPPGEGGPPDQAV